MAKINLNEQAEKIIEIAERSGVQSNFLFLTTFKRYQVQLSILNDLEASIKVDGVTVEKTYVKGRPNIYENPAVLSYNRTVDSANKTVSTLMRIIRNFNVTEEDEEEDPLIAALNGNA